jgi:hypothetical protein
MELVKPPLSFRYDVFPGNAGMEFPVALRLIAKYGRRVELKYVPRAALLLLFGAMVSTAGALENAIYGRSIAETKIPPSLFIVGHWRTGTTLLQGLLANDSRFVAPTLLETSLPGCFWTVGPVVRRLVKTSLPRTRFYDDVVLDPSTPWEDEQAVCNQTGLSYMIASMFPSEGDRWRRFLDLGQLSRAERRAWSHAHRTFVAKIAAGRPGAMPLLKSPPHTARMTFLASLFPGARFLHIHRHPYRIYASTLHMMSRFGRTVQLERCEPDQLSERVIETGRHLYDHFFRDVDRLQGCFAEVAYRDLINDPKTTLDNAYAALGYSHFELAWPQIESAVEKSRSHKRNSLELPSPDIRTKIQAAWPWAFEKWGYDPTELDPL